MISIRFPIRDVGGGGDGKGETLPCEFGQENPWLDGPITGGFWGGVPAQATRRSHERLFVSSHILPTAL